MNVFEGLVVVGVTASGVWLTREVLKRTDASHVRRTVTESGTDVAEKVGHLIGGLGRTTGDWVEKAVTGGGKLVATGTGTAIGLTASAADRLLLVHHEPAHEATSEETTEATTARTAKPATRAKRAAVA